VRTKVINGKVVKEKKAVRVVEEVTYEEVPEVPKPVKARSKGALTTTAAALLFATPPRSTHSPKRHDHALM
jgi:hypothetical protein